MRSRSTSASCRILLGNSNNLCYFRQGMGKYRSALCAVLSVAWRSGSASALQALGRGFKSLSDHHNSKATDSGGFFLVFALDLLSRLQRSGFGALCAFDRVELLLDFWDSLRKTG